MISRRVFVKAATAATALASGGTRASVRTTMFLDDLQRRTFRFFWETTNPENGLAADRWPTKAFASIAATGFALTALVVGEARRLVPRVQAAGRALTTLRFLHDAPQGDDPVGMTGYRGFFYHFLDQTTGRRFGRTELSTIDTALLLAGALTAKQYFDRPEERAIGELADALLARVDWAWAMPRGPLFALGWHPESGFHPLDWKAYNEGMLLYLLALGAAEQPLPRESWSAWLQTAPAAWRTIEGIPHLTFPPLFGHQYSHVWIDFRGIRDEFCRSHNLDYFENSRRALLAQQRYAVRNPLVWKGYGADEWGLTACDGPADVTIGTRVFRTYSARGPGEFDDGTIAPTAVGGAIPFAPELCISTLQSMAQRHGASLYGQYGFADAFNPSFVGPGAKPARGHVIPGRGWYDSDQLGIDQGPILAMAENHRTGLLWRLMRREPVVRRGLVRAGFQGGWLA